MSHKLEIICRPEVAIGFALAGLGANEAADEIAATTRLMALADDPEVGVILVEERLHDALPTELQRMLSRRPLPMIVPFPSPTWTAPAAAAEEYIIELLRQAIGYRVRLT